MQTFRFLVEDKEEFRMVVEFLGHSDDHSELYYLQDDLVWVMPLSPSEKLTPLDVAIAISKDLDSKLLCLVQDR